MTDIFVPDLLSSDRQYARYYHFDLPELEDTELTDELWALRPLLWGLPTDHWLRGRVSRLEAELKKRRFDIGSGASKWQKSKPAEGVKL